MLSMFKIIHSSRNTKKKVKESKKNHVEKCQLITNLWL